MSRRSDADVDRLQRGMGKTRDWRSEMNEVKQMFTCLMLAVVILFPRLVTWLPNVLFACR